MILGICFPLQEAQGWVIAHGEYGKSLKLFTNINPRLIKLIEDECVSELVLMEPWAKKALDLSFLAELPTIRSVTIHAAEPCSKRRKDRVHQT